MTIPAPPAVGVNVGGFVVISYTNGVRTHRVRFHVAPFDPATGVYTTPQGSEANVGTTVTNLMNYLKAFFTPAWTFSWSAQYHYNFGAPQEIVITQLVANVVGTSGAGEAPINYAFLAWNFRSTLLGRARFFTFEVAGLVAGHAGTTPAGASGSTGTFVTYLCGPNTGVVAHDGGRFSSPCRNTSGFNKKLRRKAGDQ